MRDKLLTCIGLGTIGLVIMVSCNNNQNQRENKSDSTNIITEINNMNLTESQRLNSIVSSIDFYSQYPAMVQFGTEKCNAEYSSHNNEYDDSCEIREMNDQDKQLFIDNCNKLEGIIDTIGDFSCYLPIKFKLIKYEKSNYNFYDYTITTKLVFKNKKITKKLLHSLNMYGTNYGSYPPGNNYDPYIISFNPINNINNITYTKIKLVDKQDINDLRYKIIH